MKAFYARSFGGPEASVYDELPDPVARKGQLLVEVKAASLNPVDFKFKRGNLKIISGFEFPKVLGSDFAGIVKSVGPDVSAFKPGEKVYGTAPVAFRKWGALAAFLPIDEKYARHMPEGMSFEEAASLPIAALTALNGLRNCDIGPGKKVLINGATGGVGHFAVQIARAKGAHVVATCNTGNAELAMRLGAAETMGYGKDDLLKRAGEFDAILDAYGKMDHSVALKLLKRNGIYASTLFMPPSYLKSLFIKLFSRKKLTSANRRSLPGDYDELERLFREKKLIPMIENIFPLEKSAAAFDLAEKGKPRGKIVVRI
ncbi:MAG: NADP-dependent oxidoreductase [Bacteroidales bacterium]